MIDENDHSLGRTEAISGGFNIQGSVTADYRSNAAGADDRQRLLDDRPVLERSWLGEGLRLLHGPGYAVSNTATRQGYVPAPSRALDSLPARLREGT